MALPRGKHASGQPYPAPTRSPCLNLGPQGSGGEGGTALPPLCVCARVCAYAQVPVGHSRDTDCSLLVPPKKEGPSTMPVFTVDYGELDFQWRKKTPELPTPHVPEQTEYATIVFPSRPVSPGRRASADSPTRPQPPRPEDGHCSWPL